MPDNYFSLKTIQFVVLSATAFLALTACGVENPTPERSNIDGPVVDPYQTPRTIQLPLEEAPCEDSRPTNPDGARVLSCPGCDISYVECEDPERNGLKEIP